MKRPAEMLGLKDGLKEKNRAINGVRFGERPMNG